MKSYFSVTIFFAVFSTLAIGGEENFFSYCKCSEPYPKGGADTTYSDLTITVINSKGEKMVDNEEIAKISLYNGPQPFNSTAWSGSGTRTLDKCMTQMLKLPFCVANKKTDGPATPTGSREYETLP